MNTCKITQETIEKSGQNQRQSPAFFIREGNLIRNTPAFNIIKKENAVELQIALPAYEKADVQIELIDRVLKVFSTINEDAPQSIRNQGFGKGPFSILFNLGENLDKNNIEAGMEHGILSLEIPLKSAETKEIKIH